eukprot:462764-Prorocentrum_minimum.AAC.1
MPPSISGSEILFSAKYKGRLSGLRRCETFQADNFNYHSSFILEDKKLNHFTRVNWGMAPFGNRQVAKLAEGFVEKKNWYFVHWFGTQQHGYVRKKDCLCYMEHRDRFLKKVVKNNNKWFLALNEIQAKQMDVDKRGGANCRYCHEVMT